MTSSFGERFHPILGYERFHAGVDLGAAAGTPIVAAADGRVLSAGWAGGYGQAVAIAHASGIETKYGHMSRIAAYAGELVHRGDVIGYVGSTGLSTGPPAFRSDEGRPSGEPAVDRSRRARRPSRGSTACRRSRSSAAPRSRGPDATAGPGRALPKPTGGLRSASPAARRCPRARARARRACAGRAAAARPRTVRGSRRAAMRTCLMRVHSASSRAAASTPAITSEWPLRYFVAECITMSAPSASGLVNSGVATVESTPSTAPAACAMSGDGRDVGDGPERIGRRLDPDQLRVAASPPARTASTVDMSTRSTR